MSARRNNLIAPLLVAAVIALSGCSATPAPTSTPTASKTATPPTSAPPTSAPTPVPTADAPARETGVPVGFNCTDLISLQEMYDYNPNFGLLTDYTPDNGTLAAQAVAANGTACRWLNQSSGGTIDISVAQLDTASTEARKNALAQSSTPVDAWGPDGYFDQGDLGSAAQAFPGPYWVTATSIAFFGAADAAPIMNAVTSAIG